MSKGVLHSVFDLFCMTVSDEGIDVGYTASGASSCSESSITSQEAVANDKNRRASKRKVCLKIIYYIELFSGSIFWTRA